MDKESFVLTLIAQYKNQIEEALVESQHVYRSSIDYNLLETKIEALILSARVDGLEETMVWDMIHMRIPTYVNFINAKKTSKKIA